MLRTAATAALTGPRPAPVASSQALGELIRAQRQQAELTLRELAARTNVSNPYLSQIERGLHEPSVRVLKAIANALNLSAETLLVQAGLLEDDDDAPAVPTVAEAVRADPRLNDDQRGRCSRCTGASSTSGGPNATSDALGGGRRSSQRPRRDPAGGGEQPARGSGGRSGLDDLGGLGADDRGDRLEDGGDERRVGVDQLLGERSLRLHDLEGGGRRSGS